MTQAERASMIERHPRTDGLKTKVGNHSLRAIGIQNFIDECDSSHSGSCLAGLPPRLARRSPIFAGTQRRGEMPSRAFRPAL
jgi:hypothetical protein